MLQCQIALIPHLHILSMKSSNQKFPTLFSLRLVQPLSQRRHMTMRESAIAFYEEDSRCIQLVSHGRILLNI